MVEDEDTERVQVTMLTVDQSTITLNLAPLLQPLMGSLNDRLLRVYDFTRQAYAPLTADDCWVGLDVAGEGGVLMVKVRRAERESVCSTSSISSIDRS